MGANLYEQDVIAWSQEQAQLLRSGRFNALDIEHIAEEIEDVGKSEQRELASRMAVLLAHMLKWQYQPERRGRSWIATINTQRERLTLRIKRVPSLKASLNDPEWWGDVWADARALAAKESGVEFDRFPVDCPWLPTEILDANYWPS